MTGVDERSATRIAAGTSPIPVVDDRDDEPTVEVAPPASLGGVVVARDHLAHLVDLAAAVDETIVRGLTRPDLELFVNLCHHLSGDTPLCTFEGIADGELLELALRARARLVRPG